MNVKESIFYVHLTQGDHLPSSHLLERLHCSGCPLRTVPVSRTEYHQPHSADKEMKTQPRKEYLGQFLLFKRT